jgi:hypothetical protein
VGRDRETMARSLDLSARLIGLYFNGQQVGFARVVSDDVSIAWLADVYVLREHRSRGFGVELVREAVVNGPHAQVRWLLGTEDAHGLYAKFGFGPTMNKLERPPAGSSSAEQASRDVADVDLVRLTTAPPPLACSSQTNVRSSERSDFGAGEKAVPRRL